MAFHPLSTENINITSPYKVERLNDYAFVFHTHANVVYYVSFKEDMEIAGLDSYQFIIERKSEKQGYDAEVKDSIIAIINEFFAQNNDILLYICDTSDGREAIRNRLFIRWFKETDIDNMFEIKTADAIVEGEGMFFAIIFKKSNPRYTEISNEFDEASAYLASK